MDHSSVCKNLTHLEKKIGGKSLWPNKVIYDKGIVNVK